MALGILRGIPGALLPQLHMFCAILTHGWTRWVCAVGWVRTLLPQLGRSEGWDSTVVPGVHFGVLRLVSGDGFELWRHCLKIGVRQVVRDGVPLVMAEIGVNHDGDAGKGR